MTIAIKEESNFKKVGKSISGFVRNNKVPFAIASAGAVASPFGLGIASCVVGIGCYIAGLLLSGLLLYNNRSVSYMIGAISFMSVVGAGVFSYDSVKVIPQTKIDEVLNQAVSSGKDFKDTIRYSHNFVTGWGESFEKDVSAELLCDGKNSVISFTDKETTFYIQTKDKKSFRPLDLNEKSDRSLLTCNK